MRRYLSGEREYYPDVPRYYFNATEKEMLDHFRARALRERGEALMAHFPVLANRFPMQAKRSVAASVFGAWLKGIAQARRAEAEPGAGYGT